MTHTMAKILLALLALTRRGLGAVADALRCEWQGRRPFGDGRPHNYALRRQRQGHHPQVQDRQYDDDL